MTKDSEKLFQKIKSLERPENPCQKELQSKPYESLSEEEKAELMGLRSFPDNPRGAELRKKKVLGLITGDEEKELKRLRQLKIRQEKFSPDIQELWERTETNNPNVERVDMNNGKSIETSREESGEKIIWTFGLGGCYGVIVFTEHEDGTRNCVLTHYSPNNLSGNMAKLRELISRSEKMKTAKSKQTVLIMAGGEWTQDPETKKYKMKISDQAAANALIVAAQAELGADVEIKPEPYSAHWEAGRKDEGVLAVYVPPVGKGEVCYRTWFSSGTLGTSPESKEK